MSVKKQRIDTGDNGFNGQVLFWRCEGVLDGAGTISFSMPGVKLPNCTAVVSWTGAAAGAGRLFTEVIDDQIDVTSSSGAVDAGNQISLIALQW